MNFFLKLISYIGLVLTIAPSLLVFQNIITMEANNNLMFFGTVVWFLSAPYWMNKEAKER